MQNFQKFLYHYGNYFFKKDFKHLILHVTNHCNFRCAHCFVDFTNPPKDLKTDTYEKISKRVNDLFWLDIAGGEPFLKKNLFKVVNLFKKQIVTIPTNGWLKQCILEQIEQMNKDCEIVINLSLDGLEKNHNIIRKNNQSWEKVWDTFESLKKIKHIKIRFISVIHQDNYHEIIELMKIVQKRGADFHSVILLRGDPLDPKIKLPSFEILEKISKDMFNILENYNYGAGNLSAKILRNYHRYMWKASIKTLKQKTQVVPCLAGQSHLVVWGNGDVSSCEMLPAVGNVAKDDLNEIVNGEKFKKQVKSIINKECHCTHNCALITSILFNPKKWPNLIYQKKP